MFFSLDTIIALLITYKYVIIFPIAVVEGPVVSLITGSLISRGYLNLEVAYTLIVVADLVGDALYYSIGRYSGAYVTRVWNRLFRITPKDISPVTHAFTHHGAKLLFLGKIQGLGSVVLVAAGASRYPFWRFMSYNAIGTVIKSAVLIATGYYFHEQFVAANSIIVKIGIGLSVLFVLGVLWYVQRMSASLIERS